MASSESSNKSIFNIIHLPVRFVRAGFLFCGDALYSTLRNKVTHALSRIFTTFIFHANGGMRSSGCQVEFQTTFMCILHT